MKLAFAFYFNSIQIRSLINFQIVLFLEFLLKKNSDDKTKATDVYYNTVSRHSTFRNTNRIRIKFEIKNKMKSEVKSLSIENIFQPNYTI